MGVDRWVGLDVGVVGQGGLGSAAVAGARWGAVWGGGGGGADATRENLTDAAALIVENTSAKPKTELNCCRKKQQ